MRRCAATRWLPALLSLCALALPTRLAPARPAAGSGGGLDTDGPAGGSAAVSEPQILMGPFLRDLARVGRMVEVTVVFRTTREARAAVLYRIPGGKDTTLSAPGPAIHHEFKLRNLEPDRIYVYRIQLEGKEIPGGGFTTPPSPETPVIIGVYGDTRKYDAPHAEVCAGIVRRSVDLLVHTGDLVHDGFKQTDWIRFFEIERALLRSTPMYPVIGNHDNRGKLGKWWFETLFGQNARYRSITYGPVHLVILSSEGPWIPQARWLENDLRALRRDHPHIHYVLAFIHHGPYGTGQFNGHGLVRRYLLPVLKKYGPAIIFSGHEHDYERGDAEGVPFYVTGGGGAVLGPRKCKGRCPAWSKIFKSIYHYMIVDASPAGLRICAYHPSGLEVEPCIDYPAPERPEAEPSEDVETAPAAAEPEDVPPQTGSARPGTGDDSPDDWREASEQDEQRLSSDELPPDAPVDR